MPGKREIAKEASSWYFYQIPRGGNPLSTPTLMCYFKNVCVAIADGCALSFEGIGCVC